MAAGEIRRKIFRKERYYKKAKSKSQILNQWTQETEGLHSEGSNLRRIKRW